MYTYTYICIIYIYIHIQIQTREEPRTCYVQGCPDILDASLESFQSITRIWSFPCWGCRPSRLEVQSLALLVAGNEKKQPRLLGTVTASSKQGLEVEELVCFRASPTFSLQDICPPASLTSPCRNGSRVDGSNRARPSKVLDAIEELEI